MVSKTNRNLILFVIVIAIIGAVYAIQYAKEMSTDKEVMKCIAENSILYVSKTCSHCAEQKLILGDSLEYFNLIDVAEHPEVWTEKNLIGVPTWEVEDKMYPGVKSVLELKNITGC